MIINDVDDEDVNFFIFVDVVVDIAQVIIEVFFSGCIVRIYSAIVRFDAANVEALKSAGTFLNGNCTICMDLGYSEGTDRFRVKFVSCLFLY